MKTIFAFLTIIGLFLFTGGLSADRLLYEHTVYRENESVDVTKGHPSSSVIDFDSASYYQPIIKYNLFRPLGWTPPRPVEPYRLIGTILPRAANSPPTAIIQTTAGTPDTS